MIVENKERTRRISNVRIDIVLKFPNIATITAERNINQTPGRERIVNTNPPTASRPARIKKIVASTVPSILLSSQKY